MNKRVLLTILLFCWGFLASCVVHPVVIKSEPAGATIATSDGRVLGTTPLTVQAYDTLPPHWLYDGVLTQAYIAARKPGCAEQTRAVAEFHVPDEISFQLDCQVASTTQPASRSFTPRDASGALRPFLWEVRAPTSTAYLYGTMHFCRPDCYPLPASVIEALGRGDTVAFELDITDLSVGQAILTRGYYPPGQTLAQDLPPALMQRLAAYLTPRGIAPEQLQRMRPWMARLTLSQVGVAEQGLQADHGIEKLLLKRAQELGKPVMSVETIDGQLAPMAMASLPDQREWLTDGLVLAEQGHGAVLVEDMLAAWRTGDDRRLAGVLREGFGQSAGSQRIAKGMLNARNRRMAERIGAWLDDGRNVFVAIGAAHLVGPGSVPELLAARGYATRRLAADQKTAGQ